VRRAAALALALALAGCGAQPADLFLVKRTGSGPNARLTMRVQDDGYVACNGRRHQLSSQQLLDARAIARDLASQAQLHVELPPGPRSVLTYDVELEAGRVAFSDTSRPMPAAFGRLTAFTADISEDVCGIKRG
jgi:hypothetical protein